MNSKLLLGFTFCPSNQTQRINGFRLRFDNKYFSQPNLILSLMSPFTIDSNEEEKLISDLTDEIESFFFGHENNITVRFQGLDVFMYGKKKILNLMPSLPFDIEHCTEALSEITKSYIYDRDVRNKNQSNKFFLPLARFKESFFFEQALEQAKKEFDFPIEAPVASVSLFKKRGEHWYERASLLDFDNATESFLQLGAS